MNSSKQHAFPGYDDISEQLEYAAHQGMKFSAAYCQSLLETAESYAQDAHTLRYRNAAIELLLLEVVAHLRLHPHFNKEARQSLIERAESVLKHDQNDSEAAR